MEWLTLAFNEQANKSGCEISCPSRSPYAGYTFTHPHTMIRLGHSGTIVVSFHDGWVFRLRHRTKKPVSLTAGEFVAAFRNDTLEALSRHNKNAPFLDVTDPEPLAPVEAVALEDLVND